MTPTWERDGIQLYLGDCCEVMPTFDAKCVNAVVCDPPYAEVGHGAGDGYGRISESAWTLMMHSVVKNCHRTLVGNGSSVFVIQPNSERVGRMRPWAFEFIAWAAREQNLVQDAYWWNFTTPPTVHCRSEYGLMRPSVKLCVWIGCPDCYRNQDDVLWRPSDAMLAKSVSDRALHKLPSGQSVRTGRIVETVLNRGGSTPFNLLPVANANSTPSGGAYGHPAATPYAVCEWWVRYISRQKDTVLDPFMGSGTTALACIANDRKFIGIEKEPKYFEIAVKRIEAALKERRDAMPLFMGMDE